LYINTDRKIKYSESAEMVEQINNIEDSYKRICLTWTSWLEKNNLGISLFSFNRYYQFLMAEHKAPSTINMNLVMMRSRILFLFDQVNNEIDKRATLEYKMKLLKPPSMPVKAVHQEKIFSKKEITDLICLSGKRASLIIEFLYTTACRRGELCGILLKDCSEKRHHIEITLYGKRNKLRTVMISKENYRKILNVFSGKKFLFETGTGEQYTGKAIWSIVSEASQAHIKRHMSPHMLRHTRLTHLYQETGDMKAVSLFAGHSSIKTSLDYYVHHGFDKKTLLGSLGDQ